MSKLPILLDLKGKLVVVIGGGKVAQRKIVTLLRYGARVRVYEPSPSCDLLSLVEQGVEVVMKRVSMNDLDEVTDGAAMVIVATGDEDLNQRIGDALRSKGMLVNVVTSYELSSAVFPAILELGDITIAISTRGSSPFLASYIKSRVRDVLENEIGMLIEVLAYVRARLRRINVPLEVKRAIYSSIVRDDVTIKLVQQRSIDEARGRAMKVALEILSKAGFENIIKRLGLYNAAHRARQ
ncbi:MAG: bifunctional precorrin-2 dehydrogenase/sirohydrochlorin ferrochelatase [Candidatus Nezhaarchaeota archaeon]|nr:bifunctional precorrin-2 dehydrogenase/sirohydrochlorin ferrochelatase [Candidatus Nezhaarchaeota archaeon]MCX8141216.1 bifunctional precorrin-2 dehydrogenase/sirohydrochlorin ferrochelatase [Candidatus Nezhaarchaeota archaeon]MDW8049482.1 bifunctional precorrin-2 dehydrogenase/sirohydrochlorin ferrochelatase [Nitrososphaerota archaeon]